MGQKWLVVVRVNLHQLQARILSTQLTTVQLTLRHSREWFQSKIKATRILRHMMNWKNGC